MKLNIIVHYPENMEELEDRLCDTLAKIMIKKLQAKEIEELKKTLKDDKFILKL